MSVDFSSQDVNSTQSGLRELEAAVDELAVLARSGASVDEFHEKLLHVAVDRLGAAGGAVWLMEHQANRPGHNSPAAGDRNNATQVPSRENGRAAGGDQRQTGPCSAEPAYRYKLPDSYDGESQHAIAVHVVRTAGQVVLDPRQTIEKTNGKPDGVVANRTDHLLLVVPVLVDGECSSVLEILQRPDTQRDGSGGLFAVFARGGGRGE